MAALVGCTRDLKRVHTPELWNIDEQTARRAAGVAPTDGAPSAPLAITQIHSSLDPIDALTDGDTAKVATAKMPASRDQYLLIDLGEISTVHRVTQLHPPEGGWPARYRIDVAGEHNFPYDLAFVGEGERVQSVATLKKPTRCRFLRVTLLTPSEKPWTVAELRVD